MTSFTTALAHHHFDRETEVIIQADGSDYVSAIVLSEPNDEGVFHPVTYFSKMTNPAETNYDIYNTQLIAIITAVDEWRNECGIAACSLQLISNNENVEYFMMKELLNQRQAMWSELLIHFNYQTVYKPAKSN
jgi:hypothetical protein